MHDEHKYRTIASAGSSDFRDRGSKFLGYAYPVNNVETIKEHISSLKKEHPKAVHHCVAWRLGVDGNNYRASDDGEPSGSAGKPMLGQIDSLGLTNVLVVVVRYFGGTLLGVPGLINAYKTATAMALAPLPQVERWIEHPYNVTFDYPVMGEVLYQFKQFEAIIYKQDMQLFCSATVGIPLYYETALLQKLSEIRGVEAKRITMPS